MRILFWSGNFWPRIGGIEVRASTLLPALQARGYDFVVVTSGHPDLPEEDQFKGIPIYRFPFWKGHNQVGQLMAIRQRIAQLKRSFAPDLIHKNDVGIGDFFHLTTTTAHPAPLLITLCNELRHHSIDQNTTLSQILRSADWVNSVSEDALTKARQILPEIISRSSVIQNGLNTEDYTPEPLPIDPPRFLYLGRLAIQKGVDIALMAFASIINRWPNAKLTIAGDGPKRSALEQQVRDLGLTHAIDFSGWVTPKQVPALMNRTSVVLLPSRWEGFPTVALQAALMARPVVATRVGGIPEIVEHRRTGFLVEAEDTNSLAEAMCVFLDHPEKTQEMGQAARIRVENMFGWDRYVNAYDSLYRQIITKSRDGSAFQNFPLTANTGGM